MSIQLCQGFLIVLEKVVSTLKCTAGSHYGTFHHFFMHEGMWKCHHFTWTSKKFDSPWNVPRGTMFLH